ncbi:hypothetical protein K470DRAFT_194802, partial [Piedraia hortae CBS 480.64]
LSDQRAITDLHSSAHETFYVRITGTSNYTLVSPAEKACVNESPLLRGKYEKLLLHSDPLECTVDGNEYVNRPIWDPAFPLKNATGFTPLARPICVKVYPEDMLYVPAEWFRKVERRVGMQGFNAAVRFGFGVDEG